MGWTQGQSKASFVTPLTSNESAAKEPVGAIRYEAGKKYKYILFDTGSGPVTGVAGGVVGYLATDTNLLTACSDYSDCFVNLLAGVTNTALTDAYYGWMQIGGITGALTNNVAGSPVVGEGIMISDDDTTTKAANADQPIWATVVDTTAGANLLYLHCLE